MPLHAPAGSAEAFGFDSIDSPPFYTLWMKAEIVIKRKQFDRQQRSQRRQQEARAYRYQFKFIVWMN